MNNQSGRARRIDSSGKPRVPSYFVLDCATIPPEPWANGAGTTRTVAIGSSVHEVVAWRVSLAELRAAAPFSTFDGFDRCLALIDAGVVDFGSGNGDLRATSGVAIEFPGELKVWTTALDSPKTVLNVMTRRASHAATVEICQAATRSSAAPDQILLCLSGTWTVQIPELADEPASEIELAPMKAVVLSAWAVPIGIVPAGPRARIATIAIRPRH